MEEIYPTHRPKTKRQSHNLANLWSNLELAAFDHESGLLSSLSSSDLGLSHLEGKRRGTVHVND